MNEFATEAGLKVFLHGSDGAGKQGPVPYHGVFVCPAGHRPHECPESDWYDTSGEKPQPREFLVEFFHGAAEVPEPLGKYLLDTGQARRASRWWHEGEGQPGSDLRRGVLATRIPDRRTPSACANSQTGAPSGEGAPARTTRARGGSHRR